jgi:topoisomerase-4 subunit B
MPRREFNRRSSAQSSRKRRWTRRSGLLRIEINELDPGSTRKTVDELMGTKPEARFRFIQENAEFATDLDI